MQIQVHPPPPPQASTLLRIVALERCSGKSLNRTAGLPYSLTHPLCYWGEPVSNLTLVIPVQINLCVKCKVKGMSGDCCWNLVRQGAEAKLYTGTYLGQPTVLKVCFKMCFNVAWRGLWWKGLQALLSHSTDHLTLKTDRIWWLASSSWPQNKYGGRSPIYFQVFRVCTLRYECLWSEAEASFCSLLWLAETPCEGREYKAKIMRPLSVNHSWVSRKREPRLCDPFRPIRGQEALASSCSLLRMAGTPGGDREFLANLTYLRCAISPWLLVSMWGSWLYDVYKIDNHTTHPDYEFLIVSWGTLTVWNQPLF